MNKTVRLFGTLCAASLLLTACGTSSEPGQIKDNQKEENQAKKDTSKQQKGEAKNKQRDKKEKPKKDPKTNLNEAIKEADHLHNFVVENSEFYVNLKGYYNERGIKLKNISELPYLFDARPSDQQQMLVFAGVIDNKNVEKKSKNEAIITYTVKSGVSSSFTNKRTYVDPTEVGKDIQHELRTNKKYQNKTSVVKYKVIMHPDKTATIEKLTKGDWSNTG